MPCFLSIILILCTTLNLVVKVYVQLNLVSRNVHFWSIIPIVWKPIANGPVISGSEGHHLNFDSRVKDFHGNNDNTSTIIIL